MILVIQITEIISEVMAYLYQLFDSYYNVFQSCVSGNTDLVLSTLL